MIWTPTGPPAINVLRAEVDRLQASDPLTPVAVLARDGIAALHVRRRLGAQGGVANVQVTTLGRYISQVAGPEMSCTGRRGLPVGAWRQLVRSAMARIPGRFEAVLEHPRTVATVAATLSGIRRRGSAHRQELSRTPNGRHLVKLLELVETDMAVAAERWFDDTDEAETAVAALKGLAGPPVVLFLPRPSLPAGTEVLAALAKAGRLHVVAGLTGAAVADRPLVELMLGLGGDPPPGWDAEPSPTATIGHRLPDTVVVTPDADVEARVAVAEVAAAVRMGVPLGALAVTAPTAGGRRRIGDLLDAAGLVWNGPADHTLAASVVGAFVLGVLDLPRVNVQRHAVMAVLAGAPVQTPAGGPVPVAEWARVARMAGITEGEDVWARRLADYGERVEADRSVAADLKAAVARLLRAVPGPGSRWADRVKAVERLVDELLGPFGGTASAGWTDRELEMAAAVLARLSALGGLDQLGEDPPTAAEFQAAVAEALAVSGPRRGKVGVGVTLAGPAEVAAGDFELVVVTGMVEGLLPGRRAADPLLEGVEVSAPEGRQAEQLAGVLSALAVGRRAVAVTARSDTQSVRRPSRWLLSWSGAMDGHPERPMGADALVAEASGRYEPGAVGPWRQVVPSFAALAEDGVVGSDQDLLLGSMTAWRAAGHDIGAHPAVRAEPALARALAVVSDHGACTMGPATGAALPEPAREAFSSSSLREYTTCPRQFFYHHVLRVAEWRDPVDGAEVDGLSRGSLMHSVLDSVVRRHHGEHPGATWTDEEIEDAVEELRLGWEELSRRGAAGVGVAEDVGLYRLEGMLRVALAEDSKRIREEGLELVGTELGFGDRSGGGDPPVFPTVTMSTPAGRSVSFTGRLDRLDRSPENHMVVTDYKTGTARQRYSGPGPEYLQLSLYELVATEGYGLPAKGRYWLLEQEPARRDNLLDESALGRAVDAVLDGMEAGAFPAIPGHKSDFNNCTYCRYTQICPSERQVQAEHKASDPLFVLGAAAGVALVAGQGEGDGQ